MNEPLTHIQRASRTGMAIVAAGALMIGAAWHSLAADTQKDTKTAATVTTPITHSIAGGRDSYADVVSVAAPAVVTIRTEGKPRCRRPIRRRPEQGRTCDLLARFGERFGQRVTRPARIRPQRGASARARLRRDRRPTVTSSPIPVVDGADDIRVELSTTARAAVVGWTSERPALKVAGQSASHRARQLRRRQGRRRRLAVSNPLGVGQNNRDDGIISAKGGRPSATAATRTSCRPAQINHSTRAHSSTRRANWSASARRSVELRGNIDGFAFR